MRRAFGWLLALMLAAGAVAVASGAATQGEEPKRKSYVLVAAGDIACAPGSEMIRTHKDEKGRDACRMAETAKLAAKQNPVAVMPLGDNVYELACLHNYKWSYAKSWGVRKLKKITWPLIGNHEYACPQGIGGYLKYFGPRAGTKSQTWYSFEIGPWHIIVLDSECEEESVGGCHRGSRQERWLRQDLAKHKNKCTLAAWHRPRFSSGHHGSEPRMGAFWQALYDNGAEMVLSGHDHHVELLKPLNPRGQVDKRRGIRQFVIGTGGKTTIPIAARKPQTEKVNDKTFGVLKLALFEGGYAWRFLPINKGGFTFNGIDKCH